MAIEIYRTNPLPDAFNEVVGRNYKFFVNYASQRFQPDFEDVVQDALGHFWRHVGKKGMPSNEGSFRKLFLRKIRQSGIDFYRSRSAKEGKVVNISSLDIDIYDFQRLADNYICNPTASLEREDAFSDDIKHMSKVLLGFSPAHSETILLFLEGKSYEEIKAIQPDFSLNTLRWRVSVFRSTLLGKIDAHSRKQSV